MIYLGTGKELMLKKKKEKKMSILWKEATAAMTALSLFLYIIQLL
jgi:hypothetical protein